MGSDLHLVHQHNAKICTVNDVLARSAAADFGELDFLLVVVTHVVDHREVAIRLGIRYVTPLHFHAKSVDTSKFASLVFVRFERLAGRSMVSS